MKKVKRFARKLFKARRGEEGQGMTEYIIIVVLIAIALITSVKLFGNTLKNLFSSSQSELNTEVGSEIGGGGN